MKPRRRHLVALGGSAALLLSAGCGSSDEPQGEPLPPEAVAALEKRLDEVQRRYDDGTNNGNAGACQDIEKDSYKAIDATVEGLPEDVDPDVREALEASLTRLQELTREGCSDVKDSPTETQPTPPQQPVAPPTVPQQTVPEETVPEETVPEKEKPKKDKEKGNGNGDGDGNGTGPGGTEVPDPSGGGQPAPPAPEG